MEEQMKKKRRLNPVIADFMVYACFSMAGMYIVIRLALFAMGLDV